MGDCDRAADSRQVPIHSLGRPNELQSSVDHCDQNTMKLKYSTIVLLDNKSAYYSNCDIDAISLIEMFR